MKTIKKDELFANLSGFLKSKGVALNNGDYTARIQNGCNLLTDAINATQKTVNKTKTHVDEALEKLRQSIHESTAPKPAQSRQTKTRKTSKPRGKQPGTRSRSRK